MTNPWGASPGNARNWYAADMGITTVSGKVSVWANQGTTGSADDLAQATAGNRPTYVASHTANSKPAVRFSPASSTYMQTPNFSARVEGEETFFMVFQRDGASPYSSGVSEIVACTVDQDGALQSWYIYLYNGFADADFLLMGPDAGLQIARGCTPFRSGVGLLTGGGDSVPTVGAPSRINGADWGVFTSTSSRGLLGLTLGAYSPIGGPIGFFFDGVIQEFVLFDSVLSLSDIQAVELYLSCKYQIPQALPRRRTMLNYGGPQTRSGYRHRDGIQRYVNARWWANGRASTRSQDKPTGPPNINSTMRSLLVNAPRVDASSCSFALSSLAHAEAGAEGFPGTASLALSSLAHAETGTVSAAGASGTFTGALSPLAHAESGAETITGTDASALSSLATSASGTETIAGTCSAVLSALALSVTGTETLSGTASCALSSLAWDATGLETVTGTATCALSPLAHSESAAVVNPVAGTCDVALSSLAVAATGTETLSGSALLALQPVALDAAGAETFSGTATLALSALACAASGVETMSGSVSCALSPLALSGSGSITAPVTSTCDVALAPLAMAATGTETIAGTSSAALRPLAWSGTGAEGMAGAASLALSPLAADASGSEAMSGTLGAALSPLAVAAAGVGAIGVDGSLSAALSPLAILLASCGAAPPGESAATPAREGAREGEVFVSHVGHLDLDSRVVASDSDLRCNADASASRLVLSTHPAGSAARR